ARRDQLDVRTGQAVLQICPVPGNSPYSLKFPTCQTRFEIESAIVRAWGLLGPRKGGIAMPSRRAAFQLPQVLSWVCLFVALPDAFAQVGQSQEFHTRQPVLSIPFSSTVPGSRIRDVELYSSTDQGRTWTYLTQAQVSGRREDNRFRHTLTTD